MVQTRYIVFGSLVETDDLPTVVANLFYPGRYVGTDFEVAGVDLLRVTSGSVLLPDGVLIIEDEAKNLVLPLPSFAASYTIAYQLEDSSILGGSPAILRVLPGLLRQDDFTNNDTTVIGWLQYPGGSVPLNESYFSQPAPLRVQPSTAAFYQSSLAPFPQAVRPSAEIPGSYGMVTTPVSDMGAVYAGNAFVSNGSQTSRLAGASLYVQAGVVASNANYMVYQIKKGSTILYTYDTRPTPVGQGAITAATPVQMVKNTLVAASNFTFATNEIASLVATETGVVPASSGAFIFSTETPAATGNWRETTSLLSNEMVTRWQNVGTTTETYTLYLPFVIPDSGAPAKVITRLLVDFNCITTISLVVGGNTVNLSPNSGIISNTGTLVTREFEVPTAVAGVTWTPAQTALVKIDINAQPGRGTSLAQIALTLEPTPFQLF